LAALQGVTVTAVEVAVPPGSTPSAKVSRSLLIVIIIITIIIIVSIIILIIIVIHHHSHI
jgi:hypothetical protein